MSSCLSNRFFDGAHSKLYRSIYAAQLLPRFLDFFFVAERENDVRLDEVLLNDASIVCGCGGSVLNRPQLINLLGMVKKRV